jgi:hypothetical protein
MERLDSADGPRILPLDGKSLGADVTADVICTIHRQ